MISLSSTSRDNEEYEETVFLVELQGLFDHETVQQDVEQGRCRIGLLDAEKPLIQVGSNVFVGRWESTPGTDLLFREVPHRQMLSFVGSSEKRLIAQRVLLNRKRKKDEIQELQEPGDPPAEAIDAEPVEQEPPPAAPEPAEPSVTVEVVER